MRNYKVLLVELFAALVSAGLVLLYFGMAFGLGDRPDSKSTVIPFRWQLLLILIPFVIALIGTILRLVTRRPPWLALLMLPVFVRALMGYPGHRGDIDELAIRLGVIADFLFL